HLHKRQRIATNSSVEGINLHSNRRLSTDWRGHRGAGTRALWPLTALMNTNNGCQRGHDNRQDQSSIWHQGLPWSEVQGPKRRDKYFLQSLCLRPNWHLKLQAS